MKLMLNKQGFALPTVLIASIVMLIVLLAGLTSASSSNVAIRGQYYDQLAKEAADSGVIKAQACIDKDGSANWTDASPLRPNSTCSGAATECTDVTNVSCYVLSGDQNIRTSFSVAAPVVANSILTIPVTGKVQLLRKSNSSVQQTSIKSLKANLNLNTQWRKVSSGLQGACAIASDNNAYCWGNGGSGQLGNNATASSATPVPVYTAGALAGKTIRDISVASNSACAIASDNNAYCWGNGGSGVLGNNSTTTSSVPVAVNTAGALAGKTIRKLVAADNLHACAIASDNNAYCWGRNDYGQLGNNSTTNSLVPVAVNTAGALAGKTIREIAVAGFHTCVIASDNKAYCWGQNSDGELGNNSTTNSLVPVAVNTAGVLAGKTIRKITMSGFSNCAVASDNKAYCWGQNFYGQLGNNSTARSLVPVAVNTAGVLAGKTIREIALGNVSACAIASDNNAYCWGDNDTNGGGQLGNNSTTDSLVPVAVNTAGALNGKTISGISLGYSATCAVASDNKSYCWGSNQYRQLGNNSTTPSSVPVPVTDIIIKSGVSIRQITANYPNSCVIASDNNGYCAGSGSAAGSLGNGLASNSYYLVPLDQSGVLAGKTLREISANQYISHACAIASDNNAYCWGNDDWGQLGDNDTTHKNSPVAVTTSGLLNGKTIMSISTNRGHTCAIASDNNGYCWGLNSNGGPLGNNSVVNSAVPVAVNTSGVLSGKTLVSMSLGNSFSCAVASDNLAYCWGSNTSGRLGNNSTTSSSVPVAVNTSGVLSGKTINAISAGQSHACVIASDNQAYCWGSNDDGELGNNSTTSSSVPVAVNTSGVLSGKTLVSIATGGDHACVIASDNNAYCWGRGSNLGINSTSNSSVPVAVTTSGALAGKTILNLTSSTSHSCAIASDNQAYCWGTNNQGQFGNGTRKATNYELLAMPSMTPVPTNGASRFMAY